jgi:transcriptional regulator with XRE-family HTH domain
MQRARTFSPQTIEAARLLGARIALARHERRWTLHDLAERVGVTDVTMRKIERGDPSVRLGTALEAAVLCGVVLFHQDSTRRSLETENVENRLALLPALVRRPAVIDDDF